MYNKLSILSLYTALLKLDANPNVAENDGWTPLHFAAHNGFVEIVKLLLERVCSIAISCSSFYSFQIVDLKAYLHFMYLSFI